MLQDIKWNWILFVFIVAYNALVLCTSQIDPNYKYLHRKNGGEVVGPFYVNDNYHFITVSLHYTPKVLKMMKKTKWRSFINSVLTSVQSNLNIQKFKIKYIVDKNANIPNPTKPNDINSYNDVIKMLPFTQTVHCKLVFNHYSKSNIGFTEGLNTPNDTCSQNNAIVVDIGSELKGQHGLLITSITRNLGYCLGASEVGINETCGCYDHQLKHCAMRNFKDRGELSKIVFFDKCSSQAIVEAMGNESCGFEINSYQEIKVLARCGDGLLDLDETCDCGGDLTCSLFKHEHCCDSKTCQLVSQESVDETTRCNLCEYYNENSPCRPSQGKCDPPEFCLKHMQTCPDDISDDPVYCESGGKIPTPEDPSIFEIDDEESKTSGDNLENEIIPSTDEEKPMCSGEGCDPEQFIGQNLL